MRKSSGGGFERVLDSLQHHLDFRLFCGGLRKSGVLGWRSFLRIWSNDDSLR